MGVLTGNDVQKLFDLAKKKNFAIPAVNVVGSNSINATLENAKKLNAPVIIQFSNVISSIWYEYEVCSFKNKYLANFGPTGQIFGQIFGS